MKTATSHHDYQLMLHVDMDAFFASVEQRDFPELRGKPVIVGGSPESRGVVCAASYEARRYGVRSAMPCRTAYQKCPEGIFRPVRRDEIQKASRDVFEIFDEFTPLVEPLSVDEAFLDVGGVLHFWENDPIRLAEAIRERIRKRVRLTASVGIAPNKFLAKLASDMNKPDGVTRVPTEATAIRAFLAPLDIGRIWGVGRKTLPLLNRHGLRTIGDVQRRTRDEICVLLGPQMGAHIYHLARGEDRRRIQTRREEKSISSETTFDEDLRDRDSLRLALIGQCERVGRRLRRSGMWASVVHIKLRMANFETLSRQRHR